MILVAHADDETLGAGGLIRCLVKDDWLVNVVVLSDGRITVREEIQDNRSDAAAACAVLGVEQPRFLGFPDQHFDGLPVADLANAVAGLGLDPDLIVTHVETDLNRDHRIACEIAKIVGRPKRKPVCLVGCEVPNTSFWGGAPFPSNYYVDISEEIDTKIEAFSCYRNELQEYPHPWSKEGLKLLAQYHGMQAGFAYAEAFKIIRGVSGLLP